jgi:hypothetical protein
MRDEAPAGGMPGLLSLATRVRGDIANPTCGIKYKLLSNRKDRPWRRIGWGTTGSR